MRYTIVTGDRSATATTMFVPGDELTFVLGEARLARSGLPLA